MVTKIGRVVTYTTLLLGALAAAGAGLLGTAGTPAHTPEAKGAAASDKAAKDAEPSKSFEVQGRVLGPDGKPAANAEVFLCARWAMGSDVQKHKGDKVPSPRATTDAEGKYRFSATQAEMNQHVSVVAATKDLGPDWVPLTRLNRGGGLPDLRLVKDDIPITGRVLDLESQPVAGATVKVLRVLKAPGENLWPFFGVWHKPESFMTSLDISREVKTGADGKFTLAGFGHDRVAVLMIESPDLERRVAEVITRAAVPKGIPVVCAAKADYVLAPAKPIVGVVRDKGTGKPVAGVEVTCFSPQSVEPDRATTDEKGRYRLAGVAKSNTGYYLIAQGAPFVRTARLVNDTTELEAVTADFDLQRGLEVRGRLFDKSTGRPVRGFVEYHARVDNPNLKDFPSYTKLEVNHGAMEVPTQPDGSFSATVLPGQGVIYARSWENRFTNAFSWPAWEVAVSPFPWPHGSYHAAVKIDASEQNPKSRTCEFALDPGQVLSGTVVGPDGKPLTGVLAFGLTPAFGNYDSALGLPTLHKATFTATGLDDRNPRYLLFWHKEKGLGRAVLMWGDERPPITIHLEPLGTVTGRLVDEEGKPLGGITVKADWWFCRRQIDRQFSNLEAATYLGPEGLLIQSVKTDGEGRFRIPRLIPGFSYELRADEGGWLTKHLPAPTGGVPKDLGTITIATKRPETKKP
jgi:protocatechuate 3,4-dioxygenase beta subunit